MALGSAGNSTQVGVAAGGGQGYRGAFAMVTTLFFIWGFLTSLNDILIPHLKAIFDLNYAEVMLVQFVFFVAYAVFGYPSGRIVEYIGYKRMMVAGLLIMAVGAILFIPAANLPSFPLFLLALIFLGAISYSLYLIHYPIVAATARVVHNIPGLIATAVALSLAAGTAYHFVVERRVISKRKNPEVFASTTLPPSARQS